MRGNTIQLVVTLDCTSTSELTQPSTFLKTSVHVMFHLLGLVLTYTQNV